MDTSVSSDRGRWALVTSIVDGRGFHPKLLGSHSVQLLTLLPGFPPRVLADPIIVPKSNLVNLLLARLTALNAKLALGRHRLKDSPLLLLHVRMNRVSPRMTGPTGMTMLLPLFA